MAPHGAHIPTPPRRLRIGYDYLKVVIPGSTWREGYRKNIDPMASPNQQGSSGILVGGLGRQIALSCHLGDVVVVVVVVVVNRGVNMEEAVTDPHGGGGSTLGGPGPANTAHISHK